MLYMNCYRDGEYCLTKSTTYWWHIKITLMIYIRTSSDPAHLGFTAVLRLAFRSGRGLSASRPIFPKALFFFYFRAVRKVPPPTLTQLVEEVTLSFAPLFRRLHLILTQAQILLDPCMINQVEVALHSHKVKVPG